jgi:hypothetical protein
MGKPKNIEAAKVGENYDWGGFGSANSNGVDFSPTVSDSIQTAQRGTNQYLNELLNPSYNNESFKARQDILDANNNQYANQAGANAIARGARGSATQNILNSIMANRNNDMRNAMTAEDARIQAILAGTQGTENNYFNQSNTMANNILQRVMGNTSNQQAANQFNTQARNQWMNNLISGIGSVAGTAVGAALAPGM